MDAKNQQFEKEDRQDIKRIIQKLKELGQEEDASVKKEAAELFSQLAKIRQDGEGADSLVQVWIQEALRLDPANELANEMLAASNWKRYAAHFDGISFPPMRETDNRTAKKNVADQYIENCIEYLGRAEKTGSLIQAGRTAASKMDDASLLKRYDRAVALIEDLEAVLKELLAAAEDYKESITGVFHTAVYYEQIKSAIERLESLKNQWHELFSGEESEEASGIDPLKELEGMVGLAGLKQRVNDFYRFLQYQNRRKEMGLKVQSEQSLNMVLTGSPGTGKTTIARLLAKIYYQLGVLPREEVLEVGRAQLVGAYVGQTEEKVREVVEKSIGGVLFIDEAYSLRRDSKSGDDFGQTAVDTLVSLMTSEKYEGKFAVILAGYPDEMRAFLNANPGLRSRFPSSGHFHLPDYSMDELLEIAELSALENDYLITEEAKRVLQDKLEREQVDETFGNARTARALVTDAIFTKGARAAGSSPKVLELTMLGPDDFSSAEVSAGNPLKRLNELTGLKEIKSEVQTLASYAKIQQMRKRQGMRTVPVQFHAVFTGNPGTGKTTVAEIYARLLKENGQLKRGHLVVAGRADFVAGYVGQTALKTKKKIRDALGGVLFIDEAYSLFSQSGSDFGKEAVDTLVEEMTRHHENLVVILAGYEEEMNHLLESNPGLRSRFKKFIRFPDYSAAELLEIIRNYAAQYQYQLSPDAVDYLKKELTAPVKGNGRFAANLVNEAIQIQALRLMDKDIAEWSSEELQLLAKSDVVQAMEKQR